MATSRNACGFEFGVATDVGRKRHNATNQDAVELLIPGAEDRFPPVIVLADGMGGHSGGAFASQLVLQGFRETIRSARFPADNRELLQTCIQEAHRLMVERSRVESELANMGSTVVVALLEPREVYLSNVGDSRAYRMHGKNLIQLSEDQSWVGEHVRAGLLSPQEALKHPQRNRLTMAISAKREEIKPFFARSPLDQDDAIILCSDGLWGVIPETLIWAAVNELDPQTAADKLVNLANASQGPDNISVIIARPYEAGRVRLASEIADTNPW